MALLDFLGPACGAAVAGVPFRVATSVSRLTKCMLPFSMACRCSVLCVCPPQPPLPLLPSRCAGKVATPPGLDPRRGPKAPQGPRWTASAASCSSRSAFNLSFICAQRGAKRVRFECPPLAVLAGRCLCRGGGLTRGLSPRVNRRGVADACMWQSWRCGGGED